MHILRKAAAIAVILGVIFRTNLKKVPRYPRETGLRGAACSVKTDTIASLSLDANIAEITAQELSCLILSCVYYLISSDNGSIKL